MIFTIRQTFNTDAQTYWDKVFFFPEYNNRLYGKEGLDFKAFDLLELTGSPGENRTRRLRTEPRNEAPAVVKKLIGESLTYTEDGSYDAAKKLWTYKITTSKLTDKIHIGGRLWAEPKGPKQCERISEVDVKVDIALVGGAVEKFIEKTTRESYEKTAAFTNKFIAEKGL